MDSIVLYSDQTQTVRDVIARDGVCFSKREYVQKKYQESAPVFLHNYNWFVSRAAQRVPLPAGAEFPYWAFRDLYRIEGHRQLEALKLEVPADCAVFFDADDWTKIMKFAYIGADEKEERAFAEELQARGLNTYTVMTGSFYPEYRNAILQSWERLFDHHEQIKSGDFGCVRSVQAALWCIKQEWIRER